MNVSIVNSSRYYNRKESKYNTHIELRIYRCTQMIIKLFHSSFIQIEPSHRSRLSSMKCKTINKAACKLITQCSARQVHSFSFVLLFIFRELNIDSKIIFRTLFKFKLGFTSFSFIFITFYMT